jgi:hypothetical protein
MFRQIADLVDRCNLALLSPRPVDMLRLSTEQFSLGLLSLMHHTLGRAEPSGVRAVLVATHLIKFSMPGFETWRWEVSRSPGVSGIPPSSSPRSGEPGWRQSGTSPSLGGGHVELESLECFEEHWSPATPSQPAPTFTRGFAWAAIVQGAKQNVDPSRVHPKPQAQKPRMLHAMDSTRFCLLNKEGGGEVAAHPGPPCKCGKMQRALISFESPPEADISNARFCSGGVSASERSWAETLSFFLQKQSLGNVGKYGKVLSPILLPTRMAITNYVKTSNMLKRKFYSALAIGIGGRSPLGPSPAPASPFTVFPLPIQASQTKIASWLGCILHS